MTDFSISADFGRFSRMGMRVLGDRFLNIIPVRGRKPAPWSIFWWHHLHRFLNIIPVRGRKPRGPWRYSLQGFVIGFSKHYPRKGTETSLPLATPVVRGKRVFSKHYPRKGTETKCMYLCHTSILNTISKHYPRKGTETIFNHCHCELPPFNSF